MQQMNPMPQANPTMPMNAGASAAAPGAPAAPQPTQMNDELAQLLFARVQSLSEDDADILDMALSNDQVTEVLGKLMPELVAVFQFIVDNSPDDDAEEMPIRTGMAGQGMAGAQGVNPLLQNTASRGLMAG